MTPGKGRQVAESIDPFFTVRGIVLTPVLAENAHSPQMSVHPPRFVLQPWPANRNWKGGL